MTLCGDTLISVNDGEQSEQCFAEYVFCIILGAIQQTYEITVITYFIVMCIHFDRI